MNWTEIYNRLFEIINIKGDTYYSGSRLLDTIREISYDIPSYSNYIEQRRTQGKSTSRRDYFFDLLMEQPENKRIRITLKILDSVEHFQPERAEAIRRILDRVQGPQAVIPQDIWNADRLTEYLDRIDNAITEANYEHVLTLAYTCLESFFKSFIIKNIPEQSNITELPRMAVKTRDYIRSQLDANGISYPDQTLPLISTVTNAICNARNNFSDSHSGNRAEKWLAIYMRDNVNSLLKMLLNFI